MSRPFKHPRTGIYWFRKRVPADLIEIVGRTEISGTLDTRDPDEAKIRIIAELGKLDQRWANLRAGPRELTEREAHGIAAIAYEFWIAAHRNNPSTDFLWSSQYYDRLWTFQRPDLTASDSSHIPDIPADHIIIPAMRRLCLEQADNALEHFGHDRNTWNRMIVGKAIGAAIHRAHSVLQKMAQGIFESGNEPPDPRLLKEPVTPDPSLPRPPARASVAPLKPRKPSSARATFTELVEGWWKESQASGRKPSTYDSYRRTFDALSAFMEHRDATGISREDVVAFKDHRLSNPSPRTGRPPSAKTVKDSDLSALKAVFGWAVVNGRMANNPAIGVSIKLGRPQKLRSKGFTDEEAVAILSASLRYKGRDAPRTAAAKRWVPWLCAFTGARVGEVAQLRREDIRQAGDDWVIRITPEAGTVKTNEAREVVLHPQLVDLGFPAFVQASVDGHLFLTPSAAGHVLGPLQGLKNRLAEFARGIVPDPNVAPNHGWRHRFKTIGMDAGVPPRILDAIQGQASRSVADSYGDVTLKAMSREIAKLPYVVVDGSTPS